ncbi:MAG TPA: hypothetical protein VGS12_02440 [Caulobacteraceae bacterium]|nr:hypothetical protein [Caulobacteraceae bacterium]
MACAPPLRPLYCGDDLDWGEVMGWARAARAVLLAMSALFPLAARAAPPMPTPHAMQAVLDCRKVALPDARLACYDAAVAAMEKAETSGDLVTIDRAQRRAARRQAFGLPLPSLSFLERGERPEEAHRLEAKVASASQGPFGRWTIVLDTGAVWTQTDDFQPAREPHAGSTADIRAGVLGSFFMKIDGQQAIKVQRLR